LDDILRQYGVHAAGQLVNKVNDIVFTAAAQWFVALLVQLFAQELFALFFSCLFVFWLLLFVIFVLLPLGEFKMNIYIRQLTWQFRHKFICLSQSVNKLTDPL